MKSLSPNLAPTPCPPGFNASEALRTLVNDPRRRFPDPVAGNQARQAQRAEWATLNLRQTFADEAWMRAHIAAASLRAPVTTEPASVPRLRSLLRKAGIQGSEIADAIGTDLPGYLKRNPLLPLWAALAFVLESTGKFVVKVAGQ